ncbi:unnamed protein product [Owenia fusiformis]|uniref:Uncharacterized protein n=1 Tax=Owenia fusiformis TaxID=6347 RepID=A0A8S4PTZ4_OWEFU|nr:unnamed protein product [Owenia fusiformis]
MMVRRNGRFAKTNKPGNPGQFGKKLDSVIANEDTDEDYAAVNDHDAMDRIIIKLNTKPTKRSGGHSIIFGFTIMKGEMPLACILIFVSGVFCLTGVVDAVNLGMKCTKFKTRCVNPRKNIPLCCGCDYKFRIPNQDVDIYPYYAIRDGHCLDETCLRFSDFCKPKMIDALEDKSMSGKGIPAVQYNDAVPAGVDNDEANDDVDNDMEVSGRDDNSEDDSYGKDGTRLPQMVERQRNKERQTEK